MKKYYQILGIKEGSSADEIRKAYRRLAKKYHPDINKSPDAAYTFIEINEAYEILMHKSSQNEKPIEPGTTEYQDLINRIREEAQRRARMKYEKLQREHEAFRESGLYDVGLIIKFLGLLLYPFIAIFLVFAPFYIAWYFKEPAAIAYLSFIWIIGGFLCYDIYQRRNHYFYLGGFYYNWDRIKQYFGKINENPSQECFYCKGHPANSHPFAINIIHLKSIKLQNNGPLQHKVGYNRTEEKLLIPRCRKAFIIHSIITLIKILSIAAFILFVPIDSGPFKIIGGFFTAWFISFMVLLVTKTRSKVGYLLSWAMLIKISIWIMGLFIISDYTLDPFNITTSEYLPFTIIVIMVIDVILEQVLKLPKVNLFKPLLPQYKNYSGYFSKNNLLYLEVPFWTSIYPIIRWLT